MTYQLAFDAIQRGDLAAFTAILQTSPGILDEKNKHGRTLLHEVTQYNQLSLFTVILDRLIPTGKLLKLLLIQDVFDNTPLHYAVSADNVAMVQTIVTILGSALAAKASKICNRNGMFPFLCASTTNEGMRIKNILLPITLDCSIKPLNERLNSADVLKQFPEVTDQRQIRNIELGCEAVNEVGIAIPKSSTLPYLNKHTPAERNRVAKDVDNMRAAYEIELNKLVSPSHENVVEIVDKHAKQAKAGNCNELGIAAAKYLSRHNKRVEVCRIEKGDHVFVIFDGDSKRSNDFNFVNCGPYAVIVDAWSRKVYPAQDAKVILDNLMTYRVYEYQYKLQGMTTAQARTVTTYYNMLHYLNPHYHTIQIKYVLNSMPITAALTPAPVIARTPKIPIRIMIPVVAPTLSKEMKTGSKRKYPANDETSTDTRTDQSSDTHSLSDTNPAPKKIKIDSNQTATSTSSTLTILRSPISQQTIGLADNVSCAANILPLQPVKTTVSVSRSVSPAKIESAVMVLRR